MNGTDDLADRTPSPEELRALAPAYALGALDEADRVRFEEALAVSPELQRDVEAFRVTASTLGDSLPPVAPPPNLKGELFARLDTVEQERGRDGAASAPGTSGAPAPEPTSRSERDSHPIADLDARRRRRRLVTVLSAAAALVLLAVGVVVGVNWQGPNGWGAQRELAALTEAPDAERATVRATGGGEVTLIWSVEQERSALVAEGLPDVGAESSYQLWYIDESGAASAGTFDMRGDESWRLLEGELPPGAAVGITVEPAGGSTQPTTEPIAVIPT
ncbi:anti-sigma-K factor RskA [Agromyces flavus]|uniref:Regulator of SigK n=1 Tax=Agromyces flavus TaxID=589382 RepID=A0A1H1XPE4_9MICO|nr:anti-sigma factor [Agromyces flavus]MCP2366465.1 anti-sigma-K factor RskA [Agromyces flavus]GGI44730.1 hypothetical protein GCM10010932_06080 [Agromyces flavus]SDT10636.1 Anti-sigma-K factor RskA [Agromyces flavus]